MPGKVNLEIHKTLILRRLDQGQTIDEVLQELSTMIRGGVSRATLMRRMRLWQASTVTPLDRYKEQIIQWLDDGRDHEEILDLIQIAAGGLRPGLRTLQRKLHKWNISSYEVYEDRLSDEELSRVIKEAFMDTRETDEYLAEMIRAQQGVFISSRAIGHRRRVMGMYKRIPDGQLERHRAAVSDLIRTELARGRIEDFGRNMLYTYLRSRYGIIGRDIVHEELRAQNPVAMHRRRKRQPYKDYNTIGVPGPNYAWSMDAHCKLEAFGIQVYAAIDVYSRHILWAYVGITARTAISVVSQYITAIQTTGCLPQILRTDRGGETIIAADAHYMLRQRIHGEPLTFRDCFRFGTSKQNQRIEAWWGQMSKSSTSRWKDFFSQLAEDGHFDRFQQSHRIAFLFIYMPIVRADIYEYIRVWNIHSIRKQPRRPHCIPGVPKLLYSWPEKTGGRQCAIPLPVEPPLDEINRFNEDLAGFDATEYLPVQTMLWCAAKLEELGYPCIKDSTVDSEGERLHTKAYKDLRDAITFHIHTNSEPRLTESEKPVNGRDWQPTNEIRELFVTNPEDLQNVAGEPNMFFE